MSLEVRTNLRGRKSKLTQKNLDDIKNLVEEQNDITIHEITEKLRLTVSGETVRRAVIKISVVCHPCYEKVWTMLILYQKWVIDISYIKIAQGFLYLYV